MKNLLPRRVTSYSAPQVRQTLEFKGLNRRPTIEDGEMREMYNLSGNEYPSLYQRPMRGIIDARYIKPIKIIRSEDDLCVLDRVEHKPATETEYEHDIYYFYRNGEKVVEISAMDEPRIVSINKYVCFFWKTPLGIKMGSTYDTSKDSYEYIRQSLVISPVPDVDKTTTAYQNYLAFIKKYEKELGNVDISKRKKISAEKMREAGWKDFPLTDYATLYSQTYSNVKGTKYVVITPILKSGTVLTPKQAQAHGEHIAAGGEDKWGITMGTFKGTNALANSETFAVEAHNISAAIIATQDASPSTDIGTATLDDMMGGAYRKATLSIAANLDFYTAGADEYDRLYAWGGSETKESTYGIFSQFKKGDVVSIQGCTIQPLNGGEDEEHAVRAQILEINDNENILYFPANTFKLPDQYDSEGNEIEGIKINESSNKGWGKYYKEEGNISITRMAPQLDYVIEKDNRLWGVSNTDNTIYACKLGDPTNWEFFQVTSMDSYSVKVGTDGNWTGIGTFGSMILFFKENSMTRLTGSVPSQFTTTNIECHGVQEGCSGSVATINGTCYYKSRVGVMAYAGSFPVKVSDALHNTFYSDAHAGTDKDQYYISMRDDDGVYHFLVFDETTGTWFEQDNTHAIDFCFCYNVMCYIDADTNTIMSITPREPLTPFMISGEFEGTVDHVVKDGDVYKVYVEEDLNPDETELDVAHAVSINKKYYEVVGAKAHKDEDGTWYVGLYNNRPEEDYEKIIQWNVVLSANVERDEIEWSAVFGEFHEFTENRKIYSKLQLRFKLAEGADALVEIASDNGPWRPVGNFHRSSKRTVNLPILPSRCDTFKIRVSGKGYCRIDSLVRYYKEGSVTSTE